MPTVLFSRAYRKNKNTLKDTKAAQAKRQRKNQ